MKKIWGIIFLFVFGFFYCGSTQGEISSVMAAEVGDYKYEELENGTIRIMEYSGEERDVIIPEFLDGKRVTEIGDSAFDKKYSQTYTLESVVIPEGVVRIGKNAFLSKRNIIDITLPESLTTISERAFEDCLALEEIDLPSQLNNIGSRAFYNCRSLEEIDIPESVRSIGASAFANCEKLTSIAIPDSVTGIPTDSSEALPIFWGCQHIKIYCKEGSAIWNYAVKQGIPTKFYELFYCDESEDEEDEWEDDSDEESPASPQKAEKKLPTFRKGDSREVSGSIYKNIGGNSVAYMGAVKRDLTYAAIPTFVQIDGKSYIVVKISKNALKNCKKLKRVTIGKNVKIIEKNAFSNCKRLKKIVIHSLRLKKVGKGALKGISKKARILIPKQKWKSYKKMIKGKGQKNLAIIV